MVQLFFYHRYYRAEISAIKRRLKEINREIKLSKIQLSRLKYPSSSKNRDKKDHRRFASYLSTGSFQTINPYKFRSDFIKKKRLLWSLAIIAAAIIIVILLIFTS